MCSWIINEQLRYFTVITHCKPLRFFCEMFVFAGKYSKPIQNLLNWLHIVPWSILFSLIYWWYVSSAGDVQLENTHCHLVRWTQKSLHPSNLSGAAHILCVLYKIVDSFYLNREKFQRRHHLEMSVGNFIPGAIIGKAWIAEEIWRKGGGTNRPHKQM